MNDASRVPRSGRTLITGRSGVGKTRLTAAALQRWLDECGPADVVVLEFAPEVMHDGRLVGGRLHRHFDIPAQVWQGVIDAHAPRIEGNEPQEIDRLAKANAIAAQRVIDAIPPDPMAVFINDVTIPFHHPVASLDELLAKIRAAECVVINAFDSDELESESIAVRERSVLRALESWADHVVRLDAV